MTYYPSPHRIATECNVYHTATATISVGSAISWGAQHTTGYDFSLSRPSNSTFTVPNDGHTYVFEAALAPATPDGVAASYGVGHRWEVDGTAKGNSAIGNTMINDAETVIGLWADERARVYVRSTGSDVSVVLKINAVYGTIGSIDGNRYAFDAKARVLVWRF